MAALYLQGEVNPLDRDLKSRLYLMPVRIAMLEGFLVNLPTIKISGRLRMGGSAAVSLQASLFAAEKYSRPENVMMRGLECVGIEEESEEGSESLGSWLWRVGNQLLIFIHALKTKLTLTPPPPPELPLLVRSLV